MGGVSKSECCLDATDPLGPTSAPNGPPNAFWHMRQWRMEARPGSPSTLNRAAPHWHPPLKLTLYPFGASLNVTL